MQGASEAPDLAKFDMMNISLTDDLQSWRGVYALEFPEEVLFTKPINIRPEQLNEWRPQGVTSERRVRDERGPRMKRDGL
jgi:hypothetical protein